MIESIIADLSHDPFNPELNFNAALEYDKRKQTSSAISFYLRAAEYGYKSHPSITYASLLKMAICFESQNNRQHTVSNNILQAIAYLPYRREAYFLMAQYHERAGNWQECYTFAEIGLHQTLTPPLEADVGYHGAYCLEFEKAVSAYWIGRKEQSIEMLKRLSTFDLAPEYKQAVKNNLERIDNASV